MKNFNRAGRSMALGQLFSTSPINLISSYILPNFRFSKMRSGCLPFGSRHKTGRTQRNEDESNRSIANHVALADRKTQEGSTVDAIRYSDEFIFDEPFGVLRPFCGKKDEPCHGLSDGKQELGGLTSDEKNSYASYLASLIYDYQLKLKYASICLLTFLTLLSFDFAYAQEITKSEIVPLQIGDTIPEALWDMPLQVVNHPEGKDTIRLADYRDKKLIILDFWATWCAPCIKGLTKLDSLGLLFENDLQVVPVTHQERDNVMPFLKKRQWRHISTYGRSDLSRYFPHGTIPHQVWIQENRILAVTGSEYTEARFIAATIKGSNPFVFMKQEDLSFNPKDPLFVRMVSDKAQWKERISMLSFLTKHQLELPFAREWWNGKSWMLTNFTISALYAIAFADFIPQVNYKRRLIVEVADSLKKYINSPLDVEKHTRKNWFISNTYCYNAIMDTSINKSIYRERLQYELNIYFRNRYSIQGQVEKRNVEQLELSIANPDVFHRNSRKSDKRIYHRLSTHVDTIMYEDIDAKGLCSRISQLDRQLSIPVVNAILSDRIFTLSFRHRTGSLADLTSLNLGLAKLGLQLVRKVSPLDMLVIRSLNNQ